VEVDGGGKRFPLLRLLVVSVCNHGLLY